MHAALQHSHASWLLHSPLQAHPPLCVLPWFDGDHHRGSIQQVLRAGAGDRSAVLGCSALLRAGALRCWSWPPLVCVRPCVRTDLLPSLATCAGLLTRFITSAGRPRRLTTLHRQHKLAPPCSRYWSSARIGIGCCRAASRCEHTPKFPLHGLTPHPAHTAV